MEGALPEPEPERPSSVPLNVDEIREIRAVYSSETIRVYQAYNDAIADAAVAANSFRGPLEAGTWSADRMTWIKPSAVWMAYRCGWTTKKDRNQARVLALDLSIERFCDLLQMATVVTEGMKRRGCEVIVQWDPERVMDHAAEPKQVFTRPTPDVRSMQIGLRGTGSSMLLDPAFVTKITDVTQQFQAAGAALEAGDEAQAAVALWSGQPERLWPVESKLRVALQMDAGSEVSAGSNAIHASESLMSAAELQQKLTKERLDRRKQEAIEQRKEAGQKAKERAALAKQRAAFDQKEVDVFVGGFDECAGDDY